MNDYIPMQNPAPQPTYPTPPKEIVNYTKSESVFALLCLAFGYLFVKFTLFQTQIGIATTVFCLLFLAFSYFFIAKNKIKSNGKSTLILVFIMIFSLNFSIYSNGFLKLLSMLFVMLGTIYWVYFSFLQGRGDDAEKVISKHFLFKAIKAIFVLPFSSFGASAGAIKSLMIKSKSSKKIANIIIGLCIAFPITLVVTTLLVNADKMFENITKSLFSNAFDNLFEFVFMFLLGLPFAFYAFGMLYANKKNKNAQTFLDESCEKITKSFKVMPSSILYISVTPICILYAIFFFAQTAYFLSAFKSFLPDGLTYAQYARKGFFELCAVSVINLITIALMNLLCKEKGDKVNKAPKGLKIYTIIISIFTIMLIITAMSKMVMYIQNYGLTLLRVYTSWFMLLLAIVFILAVIKAIWRKFNLARGCVVGCVIMLAILAFSNVDGIIAKHNVNCYQNGTISEIDISMMYQLSDSAVQYVLPLIESEDEVVATDAQNYIDEFELNYKVNSNKLNLNLSTYKAHKLVTDYKKR